jgi:hypothetical protein
MPYLGLDSVAEGFTPEQIVNDMRTVSARLIGLYVFNNDSQNAQAVVKSGAFVQQLEQLYGGPCVLPIITIASNTAPLPASLVQGLQQWFPNGGRRVGHDLQTTAFPTLAEITGLFQAERAAGFSPGIYGVDSTQQTYAAAQADWRWGVQAYAEGFGYLPPGYSMWQWTNNVLNNTYDGDTVADNFSVLAVVGDIMPQEIVNPPITVQPGAQSTVLLQQVNTSLVLAFVEATDISSTAGQSVGIALVGDDGNDIASTRLAPPANGTAEWPVPPGNVGTLVARSASAPIVCGVKQATR